MIWNDRERTDATLRKIIHQDGTEENVNIEDIASNIITNGTPVNGANLNTLEKNIGSYGEDTYSNESTYALGDVITYEGLYYKCIEEITTAEDFNSAHWQQMSIEEMLEDSVQELNSSIDKKVDKTIVVTTTNTNLNDYIQDGTYYFSTNFTPTNIPSGVNGWLRVIRGNQDLVIKQIWYRHGKNNTNDFETYVRTLNGSTGWSNWQRLMVENDLYYKDGDSFTFNWAGAGFLTSGNTEIQFSISLPKRVKNTIDAEITAGTLGVRKPTGGYIVQNASILTDNNIIINAYENILTIRLVHSTAYSATNNIPVGIQINNLKIDFTEPYTPGPILN